MYICTLPYCCNYLITKVFTYFILLIYYGVLKLNFVYLDTFCFNQTTYMVSESVGVVQMTLVLSRPLQDNTVVRFAYVGLTAFGKLHGI